MACRRSLLSGAPYLLDVVGDIRVLLGNGMYLKNNSELVSMLTCIPDCVSCCFLTLAQGIREQTARSRAATTIPPPPPRSMAKKKKPRCSVCGSKRFHRDGQTGRIVCDEGHLLQVSSSNQHLSYITAPNAKVSGWGAADRITSMRVKKEKSTRLA